MKKNKTSQCILNALRDGQYHSGEALGNQFRVTRSAIWKAIKQLSAAGIEVQSITGKGYRIQGGIELLDQQAILKFLDPQTDTLLKDLMILDEIDSTNDYLLARAKSEPKQILACFAETQTKGKGRRGRHWTSPFGTNIYHSILWNFTKDPAELMGLSLAIAVAVIQALKKYGIEKDVGLKWPNDILWKNKKLSGVLVEMIARPHEDCSVVIGVGINTKMSNSQIKNINQPWTSIEEITSTKVQRNKLAGLLLNELIHALNQFQQHGLEPFLKQWKSYDLYCGKAVKLLMPEQEIHGIMQGISEKGELILLQKNNELRHFLSGEVSLRLEC